jgi:hypothetical protein
VREGGGPVNGEGLGRRGDVIGEGEDLRLGMDVGKAFDMRLRSNLGLRTIRNVEMQGLSTSCCDRSRRLLLAGRFKYVESIQKMGIFDG